MSSDGMGGNTFSSSISQKTAAAPPMRIASVIRSNTESPAKTIYGNPTLEY